MLPERVQIALVANLLTRVCQADLESSAQATAAKDRAPQPGIGRMRNLVPGDFGRPWRTCYEALAAAASAGGGAEAAEAALGAALAAHPDQADAIRLLLAQEPGLQPLPLPLPTFYDTSEAEPEVEWLWQDWLPLGVLTILAAASGAGKTYVALDLARRIIHGEPFPDGAANPYAGCNVLYVDAENVPRILKQRTVAWGMDRRKLYVMRPDSCGQIDLTERADRDLLSEYLFTSCAPLVVVDSLGNITTRGENAVDEVRDILNFLNGLADRFDAACLLHHHLRKRHPLAAGEGMTLDDVRGSSHIVSTARSVLGLSVVRQAAHLEEAEGNPPLKLEVVKSSTGQHPKALGLRIERMAEGAGANLVYGAPAKPQPEPTRVDACSEWLVDTLGEYPSGLRVHELLKLAEGAGHARRAVYRAGEALGPLLVRVQRGPTSTWRLAEGGTD